MMYECPHCHRRDSGKKYICPNCGSTDEYIPVNTISDDTSKAGFKSTRIDSPTRKASRLSQLSATTIKRFTTGIHEFDRVLGGGFVEGEVVLFAAQPGTGKSTLSLSVSEKFAENNKTVLYSSGEESEQQIALRAKRMNINNDNIHVVNETSLSKILGHIEDLKPDFVVIDSLQTVASNSVSGGIGSIQQSKEAAHTLTNLAKNKNITMLLINQMTKE